MSGLDVSRARIPTNCVVGQETLLGDEHCRTDEMGAKESSFVALFHIIQRLKCPRNQSSSLQGPMKKISDLFTDEEKKQLSYLGSMLHQEPTEEEQEQQRILDAMDSPEWAKLVLVASKDVKP